MKKVISLLVCLIILLSSFGSTVYAIENDLQLTNINKIKDASIDVGSIDDENQISFPEEDYNASDENLLINRLNNKYKENLSKEFVAKKSTLDYNDLLNNLNVENNLNETKEEYITDSELELKSGNDITTVGDSLVYINTSDYGYLFSSSPYRINNDSNFYYATRSDNYILRLNTSSGNIEKVYQFPYAVFSGYSVQEYICNGRYICSLEKSNSGSYRVVGINVSNGYPDFEAVLEGYTNYDDDTYWTVDTKGNSYFVTGDFKSIVVFNRYGKKISSFNTSNYLKRFSYLCPVDVSPDGKMLRVYLYNDKEGNYTGFIKLDGNGKITGNGIINLRDGFTEGYYVDNTRWVDEYSNIYKVDTSSASEELIWASPNSSNYNNYNLSGSWFNNGYVYTRMPSSDGTLDRYVYMINVSTLKIEKSLNIGNEIKAINKDSNKLYVIYNNGTSDYLTSYSNNSLVVLNEKDCSYNTAKSHTKNEVISHYNSAKNVFDYSTESPFATTPTVNPLNEGTLKAQVLQDVSNQLILYRWLYGLKNTMTNYSEYNYRNQRGCMLLSITDDFSHHPQKPTGMSDDFYNDALKGTGAGTVNSTLSWSGNIAAGATLPDSIYGYVDESTSIDTNVGHRFSLLSLDATAFSAGYTTIAENNYPYSALSIYHTTADLGNHDNYYSWPPAGYCPIEMCSSTGMWSIVIGDKVDYNIYDLLNTKIQFKVGNVTEYLTAFEIYTDPYYPNSFYFALPKKITEALSGGKGNDHYLPGSKIEVEFIGLTNNDGRSLKFKYTIDFFSIEEVTSIDSLMSLVSGGNNSFVPKTNPINYVAVRAPGIYSLILRYTPTDALDKRIDVVVDDENIVEVDVNKELITFKDEGITDIKFYSAKTGKHISTLTVQCKAQEEQIFSDVPNDKWYYSFVKYLSEKGIMSGYTGKNAGKFGPNDSITRGQVVTILYRVFNEPDVSNLFSIFTDVQDTKKYYYNAVIWANAAGIVKGYEDSEKFGTFLPNKPISRQELAVILQRAAKFAFQYRYQEQSLDGFKDKKDISGWATDGIKWAVKKGIISGKERSDGYYIAPKDNAKRSEVAKMITMFLIKVL